jgi:hypothetical protein
MLFVKRGMPSVQGKMAPVHMKIPPVQGKMPSVQRKILFVQTKRGPVDFSPELILLVVFRIQFFRAIGTYPVSELGF